MYHCSTMPMSVHIANGMFGAVVIEPARPRAGRPQLPARAVRAVPRSPGRARRRRQGRGRAARRGRLQRLRQPVRPRRRCASGSASGCASGCWTPARTGPRPSTSSAASSTTFAEGAYLLRDGGPDGDGGSQALALGPAQGGFVELELPRARPLPVRVARDGRRRARRARGHSRCAESRLDAGSPWSVVEPAPPTVGRPWEVSVRLPTVVEQRQSGQQRADAPRVTPVRRARARARAHAPAPRCPSRRRRG